jgi:cytochrome c oxidase subunit 1/cytochrome c oxidase subunit I+III
MTGRMLDEKKGKWFFWLFVIGFNGTFFVQHLLGILGMPRRVFTYPDLPWYGALNLISSVSAFIMGLAVLVLLYTIYKSLKHEVKSGNDPWDGFTLEWVTSSPPPLKNFEILPEVKSRRPLWDLKHPENPDND